MKNEYVALPEFQGRISPLLDEARKFILFEITDGQVTQRSSVSIDADPAVLRIARLHEMGVTTVISGAVSGYLARMIGENRLKLYSWVNGPVEDVIKAYLNGQLELSVDCMKPCRGSGRSCSRRIKGGRCNITVKEKV